MAVLGLVMYIAMFLIVFVLRTVVQKRQTGDSGIRAGVLGSTFGSLEWIAGWLFLIALVIGLAAPIAEIAGLDPITANVWFRGIGVVIAATGTLLTFLAQLSMGSEWRIGIDPTETTGLVTIGAFEIVRNPIFSALLVAATGLAMMVPNLLSMVGVTLLLLAIEIQVRVVEEPHLRNLHGTSYARYESQVGRFFPKFTRS